MRKYGKAIITAAGSISFSIAISTALFHALASNFLFTFLSVLVAWTSYLVIHYTITGHIVDKLTEMNFSQDSLKDKRKLALDLLGIGLITTGLVSALVQTVSYNLIRSSASILVFLVGYMLLHYGTTSYLV